MKHNLLLLVAAEISSDLAHAAAETHHDVRCVTSTRDAIAEILERLHEIDVVVIDLDPADEALDGLAILEALSVREQKPPVLILTGLEESYMTPIVLDHGAAACLGKPFDAERLRGTLEEITQPGWSPGDSSCDSWGHPDHAIRGGHGRWPLDLRI